MWVSRGCKIERVAKMNAQQIVTLMKKVQMLPSTKQQVIGFVASLETK
jgi:hypothetical protein